MSNTVIQIKRSGDSGNTPSSANIGYGELAINYADGLLFYKDNLDQIRSIKTQDIFESINVGGTLLLPTSSSDVLSLKFANGITLSACTTTDTIIFDETLSPIINVSFGQANAAYDHANAAYNAANASTPAFANAAFDQANTANATAQAAFDKANTSTANYIILSNTSTYIDGSTSNVWGGSFNSNLRDTWAGVYNQNNSTGLFTFASGGANVMSVQMDGSLFVGENFTTDALGVIPSYGGWIVASSGIKSAYSVYGGTDVQAGQRIIVGTHVEFPDGSKQYTANNDIWVRNHANAAFDQANTANTLAQSGYNQANTANVTAQAAFDKANTSSSNISDYYPTANDYGYLYDSTMDRAFGEELKLIAFDMTNEPVIPRGYFLTKDFGYLA